jgi:hypothetical protein
MRATPATLVLAACLCLPAAALANPITIHPLKLILAGGFQLFAGEMAKGKIGDKHIVNLAQGHDIDTKVPKNEILALEIDCATGDVTLILWNTNTNTQIGTDVSTTFSMTDDIATQDKKGVAHTSFSIGDFDFNNLGNATWGITDRSIEVAPTVKYGDDTGTVCPQVVKTTLLGTIDIIVDGLSVDLLAIKGKAAAKKQVDFTP